MPAVLELDSNTALPPAFDSTLHWRAALVTSRLAANASAFQSITSCRYHFLYERPLFVCCSFPSVEASNWGSIDAGTE